MLNGGGVFEVACVHCPVSLAVDDIRDAEARAMADQLREHHPELHAGETCELGEVLDHFRVTPIRR